MQTASVPSLKVERTSKTLRELTVEKMKEAIFDGYFKPGERLVERRLCDLLAVSRSVVREVLRQLESEGLVEVLPQQGPIVALLSATQASQIYDIRALLESRAAGLCAQFASEQTLQQLHDHNDQIQLAFEQGQLSEVLNKTNVFYELMFQGAGMEIAWDIVQTLNARINRLRSLTIASAERKHQAAQEMRLLVQALIQRDSQAAEQASMAHVEKVRDIAKQILQRQST